MKDLMFEGFVAVLARCRIVAEILRSSSTDDQSQGFPEELSVVDVEERNEK